MDDVQAIFVRDKPSRLFYLAWTLMTDTEVGGMHVCLRFPAIYCRMANKMLIHTHTRYPHVPRARLKCVFFLPSFARPLSSGRFPLMPCWNSSPKPPRAEGQQHGMKSSNFMPIPEGMRATRLGGTSGMSVSRARAGRVDVSLGIFEVCTLSSWSLGEPTQLVQERA